jgi:DeoR family transcriptional regulator of aga operon
MVDVAGRKIPKLLVEERRRRILELLETQERVTVEDLADQFDVSRVTIRGDLDELAHRGTLVRSHGGAIRRLDQADVRLSVKETLHHREKVRIAHAAARLIAENDTIILDSGTTTAEIANQMKGLNLRAVTVITNGLNIAMQLAGLPHVRVIMIGGVLRQMSYSTVGPQAEQVLSGLNADHLSSAWTVSIRRSASRQYVGDRGTRRHRSADHRSPG